MNIGDFSYEDYRRTTKNCQHIRHCNPFERLMKNGVADLNGWGPCYGPLIPPYRDNWQQWPRWPDPAATAMEKKMPDPNNETGLNPTYLGNNNPTPEQRAKRALYHIYGNNAAHNNDFSRAAILREINEAIEKAKPEKPVYPVGVSVLLTIGGRLLLGRRKNNKAAGWLGTPGGRLEPNESIFECAKREFHEETGAWLIDEPLRIISVERHNRFDDNYVMVYVHADGFSGTIMNPEPEKCEGWTWYPGYDIIQSGDVTEPKHILKALPLTWEKPQIVQTCSTVYARAWNAALDKVGDTVDNCGYIHSSVLDRLRK
jgi:8-oxo-dGTP diphosphatase